MIQAEGLSFAYDKKQVLKNISLSLLKGKLYTIIGPNGSGKTTLLHSLARLHGSRGHISIDGRNYDDISRRELAKSLAILTQERNLPDMTVFDLVSAGRYPYLGLSRRLSESDLHIVNNAMTATDTLKFAEHSLKKLSGGERQRAYLAMLYAQDTPYVLLDEPTAHLDVSHGFQIMEILTKMSSAGKCVVAVLHDIPLALKYSDEVIIMSNGEIVSAADPLETVSCGQLEKVLGISCRAVTLDGSMEFLLRGI